MFHCIRMILWLAVMAAGSSWAAESLAFTADGEGGFRFNTGQLQGRLHSAGKSTGLSQVTHLATGTRLDRSMGLLSPYRLLTATHRFGTAAWDWPSTATLADNGAVTVLWPTVPERPFSLSARYRWIAPDTLSAEFTVQSQSALPGFELFLASYFQPAFSNALVQVRQLPRPPGGPGLFAAEKEWGDWQAFPRDPVAAALIQDGRWAREPNPVAWRILPELARPLAVRRAANGVGALLMGPAADVFAIACPHQAEGHYSLYLSLYGRDLKAGETAHARATLVVGRDLSAEQINARYQP